MKKILIIIFILLNVLYAENIKFINGGGRTLNPLASPDAVSGNKITVFAGPTPKSLNYYLANNFIASEIFSLLYETLLTNDPITYKYKPNIAEKWFISKDGLTFIFKLDKKAKWSDGKPITAEDVKFTYDTIMSPKNLTGVFKVGLDNFSSPEIINKYTIKFKAKVNHWKNLNQISSLLILPKHYFKDKDFNKISFVFPVTSGPYKIKEFKEGRYLLVEKFNKWWQKDYIDNKNIYNFKQIKYRFLANRQDAYDLFLKQKIDIYPVYTSRIWINETNTESFQKNRIIKQKIYNSNPLGFQGWAMNMRKFPFNDIKVRKAMCYLINRTKMNKLLMYNQYFLHKSYFEDLYDSNHKCKNKLIKFNIDKAKKLLKSAGWRVNKNGKLEKNGKEFIFNFLYYSKSTEKFLIMYQETLKKLGIQMNLELTDYAGFAKRLDEQKFDMIWISWSASIKKDPEPMWHSNQASKKGNNITGFKNKTVDELIKKQRTIYNLTERNKILRKIDSIIYKQYPYILLWNINCVRLLYWNKFGTPKTVLSKFGNETSAYTYWWFDEEKNAELNDAINDNESLDDYSPVIKIK